MSDEIKLGFIIDSSQAGRAIVDLIKAQEKHEKAIEKTIGMTKSQALEYDRFVKTVQKLNETPLDKFTRAQEQHQRNLGMLNRALQEGLINYRVFNAEAERSAAATKAADPAVIARMKEHNALLEAGAAAHAERAAAGVSAEQRMEEAAKRGNAEFIASHRAAHELGMEFKKRELNAIEAYKRSLIEEGKLDTRIAREKREADEKLTAAFVANRNKERAAWKSFLSEVKDLNTTPLERFEARQAKLNQALFAGAIDARTYGREVIRMNTELEKTGKSQESVTGIGQIAALAKAAGLYLVITRAVGALKQGFDELKSRMDSTVFRSESLLEARQDLYAASGFDVAKFRAGQKIAQELTATGASELDATNAVTMARQFTGLTDADVAILGRTQAATGGSLADKVKFAGATKQAWPGRFEGTAGTERLNEIAIAATSSEGAGSWFQRDAARIMPGSFVSAKRLGASYEELMSAGSVLSSKYPTSPETAGDRLALLVNRFAERDEFRGLGLMGSLAKLKNMPREQYAAFVGETDLGEGMGEEEYKKEVGKRIEMAQAVNALTESFDTLGKRMKELEAVGKKAGTSEGIAAKASAGLTGIGEIASVIEMKAAKEKQQFTTEGQDAGRSLNYEQRIAAADAALAKRGVSLSMRSFSQMLAKPIGLVEAGLGVSPENRGHTEIAASRAMSYIDLPTMAFRAAYHNFFGKPGDTFEPFPSSRKVEGAQADYTKELLEETKKTNGLLQTIAGKPEPKAARGAAQAQAAHATFGHW